MTQWSPIEAQSLSLAASFPTQSPKRYFSQTSGKCGHKVCGAGWLALFSAPAASSESNCKKLFFPRYSYVTLSTHGRRCDARQSRIHVRAATHPKHNLSLGWNSSSYTMSLKPFGAFTCGSREDSLFEELIGLRQGRVLINLSAITPLVSMVNSALWSFPLLNRYRRDSTTPAPLLWRSSRFLESKMSMVFTGSYAADRPQSHPQVLLCWRVSAGIRDTGHPGVGLFTHTLWPAGVYSCTLSSLTASSISTYVSLYNLEHSPFQARTHY